MRHRQALAHHLVAGDVDHHAAIGPAVTPAIGHIGTRNGGNVARHTAFQRHAVQMTAVFRRQLADERWPPHRPETPAFFHFAKAREQRIDEQRFSVRTKAHVMEIEIAGDPRHARHIKRIVAIGLLAWRHGIVKAQQLVMGGEQQAARVSTHPQPHAAGKAALEHRQLAVCLETQKEQLSSLIGGEGQRSPGPRQPGFEAARGGEREGLLGCAFGSCLIAQLRTRAIRRSGMSHISATPMYNAPDIHGLTKARTMAAT